jgi:uncharacterized cofD-like protein
VKVVAFGGGRGLSASLRALRSLRTDLDLDITAVVTVGDDGGSSGRLRAERGGLPPGDLRQALSALADSSDPVARRSVELLQYRFSGDDGLGGHAVGNLLLTGLMELTGDPVVALDHARSLVRAVGRVLPMSPLPLGIEATVRGHDPGRPEERTVVRGQHAIAVSRGVVEDVRLTPVAPVACAEAMKAVESADWLLFGPGSWFTSVIPHLLVPDLAAAIAASGARRLVTLNLAAELETAGLSLPDHLRALARYLPGLQVDVVLADGKAVGDPIGLQSAAESLRARVVFAPVAVPDGGPRHDPAALASALYEVLRSRNDAAGSPDRPSTEQVDAMSVPEDGPRGQDSNARC